MKDGLLAITWKQLKGAIAHPLADKLRTYLRLPDFGEHMGKLPVIQTQVKSLCSMRLGGESLKETIDKERKQDYPFFKKWLKRIDDFVLEKCLLGEENRLIFVVDDLDRCGVDGIVETFEAVRLVMDLENVVVIIAIDPRMALAALANHYHDLAEKGSDRPARSIARDYLGKIFQIPIQLHEPYEEIDGYIDNVLFVNTVDEEEAPEVDTTLSKEEESGSKVISGNEITEGTVPREEPTTEEQNQNHGRNDEGTLLEEVKHDKDDDPKGINGEEASKDPDINGASELSQAEQDKDDILKDTKEEQEVFKELANGFRIANPRTLKRLHNCYRLIKGL